MKSYTNFLILFSTIQQFTPVPELQIQNQMMLVDYIPLSLIVRGAKVMLAVQWCYRNSTIAVLVMFDNYTGRPFFDQHPNCVPILLITFERFSAGIQHYSRQQVPQQL